MKYLFLSLVLLSSCGSSYKRPESIEQKMERFQAKDTNINKVPEFVVLERKTQSRAPASVQSTDEKDLSTEEGISRKKLYFLTMLEQYNNFRAFDETGNFKEVATCPSFHEELLKAKEDIPLSSRKINMKLYSQISSFDKKTLAYYPELMLPVSSHGPKVFEVLSKSKETPSDKPMKQALYYHTEKLFSEIAELCEYGASDNYYTFANFETHLKKHSFKENKDNLISLTKTTVVSNLILLRSIQENSHPIEQGRFPASASIGRDPLRFQARVLSKLGLQWAKEYSDKIIKERN